MPPPPRLPFPVPAHPACTLYVCEYYFAECMYEQQHVCLFCVTIIESLWHTVRLLSLERGASDYYTHLTFLL